MFQSKSSYNTLTQELKQLSDELRSDVIFNVSRTGGHLGSSLGVVELTVALHYVFNAPQDRILWDVGHQVSISPSLGSPLFKPLLVKLVLNQLKWKISIGQLFLIVLYLL